MNPADTIRTELMAWYDRSRRDLPWRMTRDPYSIWISEVILQQTRVEQGMDYYLRFISRFPDVGTLAQASEQEVLKLWQGLGYYTRARNLLKAAQIIHEKYNGRFPDTRESLVSLPGIGEYTAAAILSIAFSLPYPVVDGNVRRVISRLMGIAAPVNSVKGSREITAAARLLLNDQEPGTFNQAMMEFGALYCKPLHPDCNNCVLRNHCEAYKTNKVNELPVRKQKPDPRSRYFHYLVILIRGKSGQLILQKRLSTDIWKNLYDFPLVEAGTLLNLDQLKIHPEFRDLFKGNIAELSELRGTFRHVLSHQHLFVKYFLIRINDPLNLKYRENWISVDPEHLADLPMPRLITRFLEKNWSDMGNKIPPFRINQ